MDLLGKYWVAIFWKVSLTFLFFSLFFNCACFSMLFCCNHEKALATKLIVSTVLPKQHSWHLEHMNRH